MTFDWKIIEKSIILKFDENKCLPVFPNHISEIIDGKHCFLKSVKFKKK